MKTRTNRLLVLNLIVMTVLLAVVAGPPAYAKGKALITGADVQDSSLTGADVQDGSLSGSDVADGSLSGADLDDSASRKPVQMYPVFDQQAVAPGGEVFGLAECTDRNDEIISGGYRAADNSTVLVAYDNGPADPAVTQALDGWGTGVRNTGDTEVTLIVSAICRVVD